MTPNEKAVKILVSADLDFGNNNEKTINRLLDEEDYETLSIIKQVFDDKEKELPM